MTEQIRDLPYCPRGSRTVHLDTHALHNGVFKTCVEFGIPVIARSPLGRGVLAGAFTKASDLPGNDPRKRLPRFQDDAMKQNIKLVNEVKALAARKGVALAQIALGWILTLSGRPGLPTIIPIPGGSTSSKVTQDLRGVSRLSDKKMAEIGVR
ncbi:Aldo/keto reductase [Aspergillus novofumigatus IBT 16806]|uniref:Aldo/keto reductase n=1 Tax=Aspergillus novofumigatus (strain IBT 16806) TaxID=1392255 RepID=A0A2I1CPD6_ASPN1|nr:Aldo/keto reductase [Aspergillus novofumigatus IBT 16806]PKX99486.1 Aldo/keto reductase [Aspergillus novofumigatus IBT 16806]